MPFGSVCESHRYKERLYGHVEQPRSWGDRRTDEWRRLAWRTLRWSPESKRLRQIAQSAFDSLHRESVSSAKYLSVNNQSRRWAAEAFLELVNTPQWSHNWTARGRYLHATPADLFAIEVLRIQSVRDRTTFYLTDLAVQCAFGTIALYLTETVTRRRWINGKRVQQNPTKKTRSMVRMLGRLVRQHYAEFLKVSRSAFDAVLEEKKQKVARVRG